MNPTPQDPTNTPPQAPSSGRDDYHNRRVEHMLATAKTKTDLQHLVRALDARNMALQDALAAAHRERHRTP